MQDAFSVDPMRDMPTERKQSIDPDNDFVVKLDPADPFGFWWVSREKGQVPAELKGAYTSPDRAAEAIRLHLNKKK